MCHLEIPPVFLTTVKFKLVWMLIAWVFKNICASFFSAVCQGDAADTAIKIPVWAEHISATDGPPLDNACQRISVLVGK